MTSPSSNLKSMFNTSAAKVFDVLHLFEIHGGILSLTQIARYSGMSVSSSQRALYTLQQLGYIQKESENKLYSLTPKILTLAYSYTKSNRLIDRASMIMHELSASLGETVNLTTVFDDEVVIISRRLSRFIINNQVGVGAKMPVYCTASGLAYISALEETQAVEILNRTARVKMTQNTEIDIDVIVQRLRVIKEQGYALTYEESFVGDATISCPILEMDRPVGALTIAVPTSRWQMDDMERMFAAPLIAATRAISR
jgi:IclR family pca regulon transcriptional regulator